ncbi:MAG: HNH endonuclease [Acidimicrobiia bacterium]|nr:HNH endonuclease [Acidimicrobiia bacterium]
MSAASNPTIDRLDAAVAALRDDVADTHDPAALVDALVPIERRLQSIRADLARRAAELDVHQRTGDRDPASWLARASGTSKRRAGEELETARRLQGLPVLREAAESGELSPEQTALVARAGEADPARQRQLLGAARREDLGGLRKEADRIIAAADDDQAARHARIHRDRSIRFWRDVDGTACLQARTTPEQMAVIKSRLMKEADAVFDAARRDDRREPYEAYLIDALANQCTGSNHTTVPPKRDLLIHIDLQALLRGRTVSGERCEIVGVGPVPVEVAADLDANPFIKAVIRDGLDIRTVAHFGRHVPAELRTALEARASQCEVPGCAHEGRLEFDHAKVDFAAGGPHALWNDDVLCDHHHDLKTNEGYRLDGPPGRRRWLGPAGQIVSADE